MLLYHARFLNGKIFFSVRNIDLLACSYSCDVREMGTGFRRLSAHLWISIAGRLRYAVVTASIFSTCRHSPSSISCIPCSTLKRKYFPCSRNSIPCLSSRNFCAVASESVEIFTQAFRTWRSGAFSREGAPDHPVPRLRMHPITRAP